MTGTDPYKNFKRELVEENGMSELEAHKWEVSHMSWNTMQTIGSSLGIYERSMTGPGLMSKLAKEGIFGVPGRDGRQWYIRVDGESVPIEEYIEDIERVTE